MDAGWECVADAVRDRMQEIGLSQRGLARRSDISDTKLRDVLHGNPLARGYMRTKLAHGLGWTGDSIDRILAGDDPVIDDAATSMGLEDKVDAMAEEVGHMRGLLEQIAADLKAGS